MESTISPTIRKETEDIITSPILQHQSELEEEFKNPPSKPDSPLPSLPVVTGNDSPFFTPSNPCVVKHRQLSVSRVPPLTPANRYPSMSLLTSTPACNNCLLTPSPMVGSTEDMSPITLSTQRMSKAMQVTFLYYFTNCCNYRSRLLSFSTAISTLTRSLGHQHSILNIITLLKYKYVNDMVSNSWSADCINMVLG